MPSTHPYLSSSKHASLAGQLGTGAPAAWATTATVTDAADTWGRSCARSPVRSARSAPT
jgi:hypothetical protein